MPQTELESLIFAMDVNLARMDKKLAKLNADVKKSAQDTQRNLDGLGNRIGGHFTSAISGAASQVPILADELLALGGPVALAAVGGLAAVVIGLNQAKKAMDWADVTQATADKIGITAEELQKLQFAAGEADVEISAMEDGVKNLNAALGAMQSGVGNGKIEKVFKALKISDSDLKGMNDASDLLPLVADRISQLSTKAEQVQIARKLGIEALLPMLERGGEAFRSMGDRASDLGLVIDNETTAKLAAMSREVEIAQQRIDVQLKTAFLGLAPAIEGGTKALADFLSLLNQLNRQKEIFYGAPRTRAEIGKDLVATMEEQKKLARAFRDADSEKARFGLSQPIKANQAKLAKLGRELISLGPDAAPKTEVGGTTGGDNDDDDKPKRPKGKKVGILKDALDRLATSEERVLDQIEKDREVFEAALKRKDLKPATRSEVQTALERLDAITPVPEGLGPQQDVYMDASGKVKTRTADREIGSAVDKLGKLPIVIDPAAKTLEAMRDYSADIAKELGYAVAFGEDLGDALSYTFRRIAADWISSGLEDIFKQLIGGGSEGGSGESDWAKDLISGITQLFGSNSGSGGARAGGGPVRAGMSYRVNERGEEFFVPNMNGMVISNKELKSIQGSALRAAPLYAPTFDLRGAVVTQDLLDQMNAIGRRSAEMGAAGGAGLADYGASRRARRTMS